MKNIVEKLSEEEQAELLGEQQEQEQGQGKPSISWPEPLAEEAFHGLAGDIVKAIEPHTEADPAALLFSQFALYGNVVGRTAYFVAEADYHYLNLFTCLVGATAKGRKGVSFNQVKRLYEGIDDDWTRDRITQGLSSGEGLIWQVRDEQKTKRKNKKGEEEEIILVDGIDDKRLLTVEQEFASTIRVLRREGNTLSAVIRKAWDDGNLNTLTKNSPAKATDAHISILAHITKDELLRYLDNTEMANGFGNRFLWACVKRSKTLPEGGQLHTVDFAQRIKQLRQAVEFGRITGEIRRDKDARELWFAVYPGLSEGKPGLLGAMLARAEAQVMRLACIYALMDLSNVIKVEHLQAALAVWDYCERSARFIFGDSLGDPVADEILKALKEAGQPGMTRTDIFNYFGRHKNAREITRALNILAERGMACCQKTVSENNRPIELWIKT